MPKIERERKKNVINFLQKRESTAYFKASYENAIRHNITNRLLPKEYEHWKTVITNIKEYQDNLEFRLESRYVLITKSELHVPTIALKAREYFDYNDILLLRNGTAVFIHESYLHSEPLTQLTVSYIPYPYLMSVIDRYPTSKYCFPVYVEEIVGFISAAGQRSYLIANTVYAKIYNIILNYEFKYVKEFDDLDFETATTIRQQKINIFKIKNASFHELFEVEWYKHHKTIFSDSEDLPFRDNTTIRQYKVLENAYQQGGIKKNKTKFTTFTNKHGKKIKKKIYIINNKKRVKVGKDKYVSIQTYKKDYI